MENNYDTQFLWELNEVTEKLGLAYKKFKIVPELKSAKILNKKGYPFYSYLKNDFFTVKSRLNSSTGVRYVKTYATVKGVEAIRNILDNRIKEQEKIQLKLNFD